MRTFRPSRLVPILAAFALVAAACGGDDNGGATDGCLPIPGADDTELTGDFNVGMTFDLLGRGDQSFNDAAACGLDKAVEVFGVSFTEVVPTDESARGTNLQLQAEASDLVIGNGFSFEADLATIAPANPDVNFAITDASTLDFSGDSPVPIAPNAAGMVFAEQEGSYLVGVAAALKSETDVIGFIGGVSGIGLIEKFEAGFTAGARAINPDIQVIVQYITEFPDFDGFQAPDRGKEIALAMYDEGADIIYAAAGLSGSGMFAAAKEVSEEGDKVWGIGVDSDQYLTVDPSQQEYVLTSMLKRVDVAVFNIIKAQIEGTFNPGPITYDLAAGGVGYSTSGGFIDDIVDEIDDFAERIVSGDIVVPTLPEDA